MCSELPIDVWKEILVYITDVRSLHFAQLTCKKWRAIIVELRLIDKASGGILNIPKIYDFNDWGSSGLIPADFDDERKAMKKLRRLDMFKHWEECEFQFVPYNKQKWGQNHLRIVVIGQGGSGKSASTIMYIQQHFIEEYDPTIEDSYRKQVSFCGKQIMMDILDTAGCEEFSAMRHQYLVGSEIIICLFALDNRESLETARLYLEHERIRSGSTDDDEKDLGPLGSRKVLIVANKCDLPRVMSHAECVQFARDYKCGYIETSAKFNNRIEEAFQEVIKYSLCRRILAEAKLEGNPATQRRSNKKCGIQ